MAVQGCNSSNRWPMFKRPTNSQITRLPSSALFPADCHHKRLPSAASDSASQSPLIKLTETDRFWPEKKNFTRFQIRSCRRLFLFDLENLSLQNALIPRITDAIRASFGCAANRKVCLGCFFFGRIKDVRSCLVAVASPA